MAIIKRIQKYKVKNQKKMITDIDSLYRLLFSGWGKRHIFF